MENKAEYYKNQILQKTIDIINQLRNAADTMRTPNGLGSEHIAMAIDIEVQVYERLKREVESINV
jgi:hypothetical protein